MTREENARVAEGVQTVLRERWGGGKGVPDTTIAAELRKGTHWLVKPTTSRPAISTFLKTVLHVQGWTQTSMSRKVGMNVCNLNRLVMGGPQSCAPATKAKFGKLVADVPELKALYEETDWGLSA